MRKLIVSEFLSLDGVMEDPGGSEGSKHGGWSFKFNDPEGMRFKLEEVMVCDAMLLGRVTYEGFAAAWPSMKDEVGFAEKMNGMAKLVVSSTLAEAIWSNSSVIDGDLREAVQALKSKDGGDVLVAGSATLVRWLLAEGLIDELRLMVHPIVLGSGKRLFGELDEPAAFELAQTQLLASGSVILTYRPRADVSS
jgi:dihydrofolate reductase